MVVRSHEKCLELVCAVCTNLNGYKAKAAVSDIEVALIQKHVFPGYQKGSIWFPQGMCVRCALDIRQLDKQQQQECPQGGGGDDSSSGSSGRKRNIVLNLPDDYICNLPVQTRSQAVLTCTCRWCYLARLCGGELNKWKANLKKNLNPSISHICKDCGRGISVTVKSHTSHVKL